MPVRLQNFCINLYLFHPATVLMASFRPRERHTPARHSRRSTTSGLPKMYHFVSFAPLRPTQRKSGTLTHTKTIHNPHYFPRTWVGGRHNRIKWIDIACVGPPTQYGSNPSTRIDHPAGRAQSTRNRTQTTRNRTNKTRVCRYPPAPSPPVLGGEGWGEGPNDRPRTVA
jgi:hypothetical protein